MMANAKKVVATFDSDREKDYGIIYSVSGPGTFPLSSGLRISRLLSVVVSEKMSGAAMYELVRADLCTF